MKEEQKVEEYINYLRIQWLKAEEVATNILGVTDTITIAFIFDKLSEPYGYWKKRFNY